jgi:hypothetical protein
MRNRFSRFITLLVLFSSSLSLILVSPGDAQGWPWDLFGSGQNKRDRSWDAPLHSVGPPSQSSQEVERGKHSYSGTYRTWCVRLCDGFYFPISHSTTRGRFSRDAKKCEVGCPQKSRLFVQRTSGEVDDMTDLEGEAYRDLKNAFRYRQEYVADCTCRAHPWHQEAIARHQAYAEAAKAPKHKAAAKGSFVASAQEKGER